MIHEKIHIRQEQKIITILMTFALSDREQKEVTWELSRIDRTSWVLFILEPSFELNLDRK